MSDSQIAQARAAGVSITLGNPPKEHRLIYTGWAVMHLEEVTGKNYIKGEIFSDLGIKEILACLWAGILHEKDCPTFEAFAQSVDISEVRSLAGTIIKAMDEAGLIVLEKKTGEAPVPPPAPEAEKK